MPNFVRRGSAALLTLVLLAACDGKAGPHASGARTTSSSAPRGTTVAPAAAQSSAAAVVDTGPAMQGTHAIIRPEAVGPLHVGSWRRAAMSFVYTMTVFSGPDGTEIVPVHGLGNDTVTVVVVNDTVTQIEVMRPGAHTRDGVQVGTPLAMVRALPGAMVGHDGAATTITLPHECGVVFSTADSSAHSGVPRGKAPLPFSKDSAVVRTIIVGKCAGA